MGTLQKPWPGERARLEVPRLAPESAGPGVEKTEGEGRYDLNPQLAVIESYALDVIGELSPEEITETDDAVTELFGASGDWRHRVRQRFGWNPLMDSVIADNWCRFRRAVKKLGDDPDPAEFARRFADEVVRLSKT
jgi:hypothetical protein